MEQEVDMKSIKNQILDYYFNVFENERVYELYIDEFNLKSLDITEENSSFLYAKCINTYLHEEVVDYAKIKRFTGTYSFYCFKYLSFVFREIIKDNELLMELYQLCLYEVEDSVDEYCLTQYVSLKTMTEILVNPQNIQLYFDRSSEFNSDLCTLSLSICDSSVKKYLFRCLETTQDSDTVEFLLESLIKQKDKNDLAYFENLLLSTENAHLQEPAIRYFQIFDHDKRVVKILSHMKEKKGLSEYNYKLLAVTLCKVENGLNGLLSLYRESKDIDVKRMILECYTLYRNKEFASLLYEEIDSDVQFENEYNPIRADVHDAFLHEKLERLLSWFGEGILKKLDEGI